MRKRFNFTTLQFFRFVGLPAAAVGLCIGLILEGNAASHKAKDEAHPAPHSTQHLDSRWEFYIHAPGVPVEVTSFDGERVYYTFYDIHEVKLGSFDIEGRTTFPPGFRQHPEGCYNATFCVEHNVLYFLEPIEKKYCGKSP